MAQCIITGAPIDPLTSFIQISIGFIIGLASYHIFSVFKGKKK